MNFNVYDSPVAKETPRYSSVAVVIPEERAPCPEIRASPMAATTSISAGLSLWTDVGL